MNLKPIVRPRFDSPEDQAQWNRNRRQREAAEAAMRRYPPLKDLAHE